MFFWLFNEAIVNYFYFIGENNKYQKSVLSHPGFSTTFPQIRFFTAIFTKPLDFLTNACYPFLALCHTGVDGCWCTPWSSKPVIGVNSFLGGFDSHARPPCEIPAERSAGIFLFFIMHYSHELKVFRFPAPVISIYIFKGLFVFIYNIHDRSPILKVPVMVYRNNIVRILALRA